ncbi:MAG TPA: MBL fold metallo-hydrolase [Anaeromyxobacteraceae bacterium]|nr:MBL fold metallo-hydrolase [Anaeromyxobacteraceae bacterium]
MTSGPPRAVLRRLGRIALGATLLVAVAGALALLAVRVNRGSYEAPAEVAPGIFAVRSAGGVWLYAARAGASVLLFDAGADPEARPVDALLRAMGARRAQVTDVFLTHAHGDHVAAVGALAGARVHAGAADVEYIEGRRAAGPLSWLTSIVLSTPAAPVSDPITEECDVEVPGGEPVHAIPLPGHTPGSCAFVFHGVVFAGDILAWKGSRLGTGPAFFDHSPSANEGSARSLVALAGSGPGFLVCTGHTGCTPAAAASGRPAAAP